MAVAEWVARYKRSWRSPGTDALREAFTETVSYSPSPWAQPIEGLDALGRFWDASRSGPGSSRRGLWQASVQLGVRHDSHNSNPP